MNPLLANLQTLQQAGEYLGASPSVTRAVAFVAAMLVVTLVWAVAFYAVAGKKQQLGQGTTHLDLLRDLCLLHQLDQAERQVVQALAKGLPEVELSRIFTDPRVLREQVDMKSSHGRLCARLLNRLFQ